MAVTAGAGTRLQNSCRRTRIGSRLRRRSVRRRRCDIPDRTRRCCRHRACHCCVDPAKMRCGVLCCFWNFVSRVLLFHTADPVVVFGTADPDSYKDLMDLETTTVRVFCLYREGLVRRLAGELSGLATTKHGSRALDSLWKFSSLKIKQVSSNHRVPTSPLPLRKASLLSRPVPCLFNPHDLGYSWGAVPPGESADWQSVWQVYWQDQLPCLFNPYALGDSWGAVPPRESADWQSVWQVCGPDLCHVYLTLIML